MTDADILRVGQAAMEAHDSGDAPDIAHQRYKRSAAIHADAADRKGDGETGAATGGGKRQRPAAGGGGGGGATGAPPSKRGKAAVGADAGASAAAAADDACSAEGGCGAAAEEEDAAAEGGAASAPAASGAASGSASGSGDAVGAAFTRAVSLLVDAFATPSEGRFAAARLKRARVFFDAMLPVFGVPPNARSYVLVARAALDARDAPYARQVLREMTGVDVAAPMMTTAAGVAMDATAADATTGAAGGAAASAAAGGGASTDAVAGAGATVAAAAAGGVVAAPVCTVGDLYQHLQPAFVRELVAAGVMHASVADVVLSASAGSRKWCFLQAAAAASRGDQWGSKHGAVLVAADGRFLAAGHNHRFGVPREQHIRTMHSEVHALVQLPSLAAAAGSECYIVELDGHACGYEEAVPCPMCQRALCRTGVGKATFSSHAGLKTLPVTHKPDLSCAALDAALVRVYPDDRATNPDAGLREMIDAAMAAASGGGSGSGSGGAALAAGGSGGASAAAAVAAAGAAAAASTALADAAVAAPPGPLQ